MTTKIFMSSYLGDFVDMTDDEIVQRLNDQFKDGIYRTEFTLDDLDIARQGSNANVRAAVDKVVEVHEVTEADDKVRCNNCMRVFDLSIEECPVCETDAFLMNPFIPTGADLEGLK